MKLSPAGLALIKKSEGFRDRVYFDAAGIATIGFGHRVAPGCTYTQPITEAVGLSLLQNDVLVAEQSVRTLVKVPLTQGQFDALVDWVFNLGFGRLAHSTLLAELNASHYNDAAIELMKWDHAGGEVLDSLKARRLAEYKMFTGAGE